MAGEEIEAFTLLALGMVIIALRIVVRWRSVGLANLQLDDYFMVLAGILFIIDLIAAMLVVTKANGLTNSYMTDEQRAALSPDSPEYMDRVLGSKIQVIGWNVMVASLWCIKASVAIFYSRLTAQLAHLRLRVYIAYALIGVTWLVTTLLLLFGCRPMSKYWQINPDPGGVCQPTNGKLYVFSVLIPDLVTDLYLLSIPLPLLWAVNIGIKKKVSLVLLFSMVVFVMMAAIIRGVVILTAGPEGAISGSQWAIREEFVALVVTNLLILQAPIRNFCTKIGLGMLFSTRRNTSNKAYEGRTIGGGYPLETPTAGTKPDGTVAAWDRAAWDSDEQILCENGTQNKNIVVAREVAVESESGSLKEPGGWTVSVAARPRP
ncbi:hypothetical protein QBC40DRAFT_197698 [Triangularia verruculosa]|uniref:Rhodopsin domain-containing protein n=1 Tax=Triangularia verruculosa TaxID=2587418 RepID=A0AAN6XJ74_9PEZI|nr:hypothetical protein QBC40DRAFT_197698 [Triangularia verruculosa]